MSPIAESGTSSFPTPQTPVLIIGGGPIGTFCGILLARYNIRSTIVERHSTGLNLPRGHALGPRTLEIFRQIGLDINRLRKLGTEAKDTDVVRFLTSMVGYEYGNVPLGYGSDDALGLTPEPLFNIPQPLLENYLYEVAAQTGLVTLWRDTEWRSSSVANDGLEESVLFNRKTNMHISMRSKYLLSCDGAHSKSRAELDIFFSELPGQPTVPTHYLTVYFEADLSHLKSGLLYFVISPFRGGTFICYHRNSTWAFVMTYDPETTPKSVFTEEHCRNAVATALGSPIPFKIVTSTFWSTHPRVVNTFKSPNHPRAFVLGDAAHTFPPTGGLGLNTGFADAHNLAWKIHAVESGWSPAEARLLASYDAERRPVALANARQSYLNQRKLAESVETILATCKEDPSSMGHSDAQVQLEKVVMENWDHFNAIDLHIGYVYGSDKERTRSIGEYIPECSAGARLPHAWVQVSGQTRSTLDFIDGRFFVVLATPNFPTKSPILTANLDSKIPLKIFTLGADFTDKDGAWSELINAKESESAILVRPDQHIGCFATGPEDLAEAIEEFWGSGR